MMSLMETDRSVAVSNGDSSDEELGQDQPAWQQEEAVKATEQANCSDFGQWEERTAAASALSEEEQAEMTIIPPPRSVDWVEHHQELHRFYHQRHADLDDFTLDHTIRPHSRAQGRRQWR